MKVILKNLAGRVDVFEYSKILANSRQHLIDAVDQYIVSLNSFEMKQCLGFFA